MFLTDEQLARPIFFLYVFRRFLSIFAGYKQLVNYGRCFLFPAHQAVVASALAQVRDTDMFYFYKALFMLQRVCRDRRGVTALEYALLAGAIAAAVVAAAGVFSGDLKTAYGQLGTQLTSITAPS